MKLFSLQTELKASSNWPVIKTPLGPLVALHTLDVNCAREQSHITCSEDALQLHRWQSKAAVLECLVCTLNRLEQFPSVSRVGMLWRFKALTSCPFIAIRFNWQHGVPNDVSADANNGQYQEGVVWWNENHEVTVSSDNGPGLDIVSLMPGAWVNNRLRGRLFEHFEFGETQEYYELRFKSLTECDFAEIPIGISWGPVDAVEHFATFVASRVSANEILTTFAR